MGMNWETSIVPVPETLRLAAAPAPLEAAKSHRPDLRPILVSPPKKTNSSRRNRDQDRDPKRQQRRLRRAEDSLQMSGVLRHLKVNENGAAGFWFMTQGRRAALAVYYLHTFTVYYAVLIAAACGCGARAA